MADRPIVFSGPMVLALLAGTKTQHREIIDVYGRDNALERFTVPYAVGDRLDPALLIAGYPDYCAGISGRVYSRKSGAWEQLQACETSKGYPAVTLCSPGQRRTTHTHAVTCEAFHGPRPSKSHQVRHINGNVGDGCAANLCWGTQLENWQDRKAHGNGCEGEKHHHAKFSNEERGHIRWGLERGLYSQRHAARILGVTQSTIYQILHSKSAVPVEQISPDHSCMRLTLKVTDVRVQRLAEITDVDAIDEGALRIDLPAQGPSTERGKPPLGASPRQRFAHLWDSLHGKGAFDVSPWVAALTFAVVPANIDNLPEQS